MTEELKPCPDAVWAYLKGDWAKALTVTKDQQVSKLHGCMGDAKMFNALFEEVKDWKELMNND